MFSYFQFHLLDLKQELMCMEEEEGIQAKNTQDDVLVKQPESQDEFLMNLSVSLTLMRIKKSWSIDGTKDERREDDEIRWQ